jgi:serine phosphatase RsbU (regulator of sigma subunit)
MTSEPTPVRLELLYHLAQAFSSSLDLDEVLNRVIDEVIQILHAERGFLMLYDEKEVLVTHVARNIEQSQIEQPGFQVSRGMVEKSAREGIPILASDAQTDSRFSSMHSVLLLGLRSVLCVPLQFKNRNLGAIFVDNRMQTGVFSQSEVDLLMAIASSAAIAIENARLYALAVEKGRLEKEMQVAREVQTSLLPRILPDFPEWEFAVKWIPARQVAGDYYDFFPLTSQSGMTDQLGFLIADVTDKGMPAALFMALTRSTIRASVIAATSPDEGITRANRLICADSPSSMFVTVFYGQLDLQQGLLTYVNAGHNPPILFHKRTNTCEYMKRTGMVLGVDESVKFEQRQLIIEPDDFLFLYTDGIPDAINNNEDPFDMARLQSVIERSQNLSGEDFLDAIVQEIQQFIGERAVFDDITMAFIRRRSF